MSIINMVNRMIVIIIVSFEIVIMFRRNGVIYFIDNTPSTEKGSIVSRHILPFKLYFKYE